LRLGYGLGSPVFESRQMSEFFLFAKFSTQLIGPPNCQFSGYGDSASEAKRLGCDVDYSPPSSAEVKNEWSYTSTPPMKFPDMGGE